MQSIVAWINCYGAWDPINRKPVEMIGYNHYLDGVVSALALVKDRVKAIHLSGGMLDEQGRTECATTKPELERRLKAVGIMTPITTDEDSITSAEIVKRFVTAINAEYKDYTPLLFCDMVRRETNNFLLEEYAKLAGAPVTSRDIIVPIERLDSHPNSTPEVQKEKLAQMKEQGIEAIDDQIAEARRKHNDEISRSSTTHNN